MLARTPATAARQARQQRYRERIARHQVIAEVVVGERELDLLVRTGWLAERDAHRRECIGDAIARMLTDARDA